MSSGLHRLPIGDFPLLRGLASVLAGYDGAAELERGLDILFTGLTTTPDPARRSPPALAMPASAEWGQSPPVVRAVRHLLAGPVALPPTGSAANA